MLKPTTSLLLLVATLVACESRPAATDRRVASRAPTPAAEPVVTADIVEPLLPTKAAANAPSWQEASQTVAPGLVVFTRGTVETTDSAVVPRRILQIRRNGQILYADTTAEFSYPLTAEQRRYPLWLPTGPGRGELLVRLASPPNLDIVRRFFLDGQRVTHLDTLPAFDEAARNLDSDSLLEFSGYRNSGEVWEDDDGHRRTSYNPLLYYEIRPTGLVLDSTLIKQKALARYGVFRGFQYSDKPGIRLKK